MDDKLSFEIKRKIFHFFSISYILLYYYLNRYFNHQFALLCLTLIFILLLSIEVVKIKYQKKVPLFHFLYREKEKNTLSGSIFLLLGVIISFAIYDFKIAVAALLMMIFGDITAALFGIKFGNRWFKKNDEKSWEGIIMQFLVNFLAGFFILRSFFVVLLMAFVATLVGTTLTFLDDNLSVPVFAGFAGQLALIFLKIFRMI